MTKVNNGNPVCDNCGETVGIVHRSVPYGESCKEWFCDECMNEKGIESFKKHSQQQPTEMGKDECTIQA